MSPIFIIAMTVGTLCGALGLTLLCLCRVLRASSKEWWFCVGVLVIGLVGFVTVGIFRPIEAPVKYCPTCGQAVHQ